MLAGLGNSCFEEVVGNIQGIVNRVDQDRQVAGRTTPIRWQPSTFEQHSSLSISNLYVKDINRLDHFKIVPVDTTVDPLGILKAAMSGSGCASSRKRHSMVHTDDNVVEYLEHDLSRCEGFIHMQPSYRAITGTGSLVFIHLTSAPAKQPTSNSAFESWNFHITHQYFLCYDLWL